MSEQFMQEFAERCETEIPYVRRYGRYGFFGFCAIGAGVLPAVALSGLGIDRDIAMSAVTPSAIAVFLILREMSKEWDCALHASKAARAAIARAKGGE